MLAQEDLKIYRSPPIALTAAPNFQDVSLRVKSQPLPAGRRTSESALQSAVVAHGDRTVSTRRIPFNEAEIMRWLGNNTAIPVPRDIQHGYDDQSQQYFLSYQTPAGTPLDLCWDALEPFQQRSIVAELRQHMLQLRQIRPSQIPNLKATDCFLDPRDGTVRGPYHTTNEFLEALSTRIESIGALYEPTATRRVLAFLRALQQDNSAGQDLTFTHGKLYAENILVNEAGEVVAILDWSQAGYAPPFWEYIKSCLEEDDSNFFLEGILDEVLEPWPFHLAIMMHARDIIWG